MRRTSKKVLFIAGIVLVIVACSVSAVEESPALSPEPPTAVPETATGVGPDSGSQPVESVDPEPTISSATPEPESQPVESTDPKPTIAPAADESNEQKQLTESPAATITVDASPTPSAMQPASTLPDPAPTEPVAESNSNELQVSSMFGPVECRAGEEDIELTHLFYEPALFDALVPMGRMWDSHVTPTDHLYVFLYEERERKMVRTPAAGRVIQIGSFPRPQSPFWDSSIEEPDLRVIIAHSCTLFSIFIHVGELAPSIAAVVGEIEQGGRWYAGPDEIVELDAGDPIALLGGSSFDYSLHDETKSLTGFQIPEHYEREAWKVHTVDPFDYMSDELVAALLPKNVRQVEPYGGKIDYDVAGALVGNWFLDGTVDYSGDGSDPDRYWNGHLSISYDHVDPSEIRISIGRDIGLTFGDCRVCGGVYAVNNNTPDPATVTAADGIVKYELTGRMHGDPDNRERTVSDGTLLGTFLAQVIDDETIRTEFVLGATSNSVPGFSENSFLYRR